MSARPFLILYLVASLAGFVFASFSTSDFVQHLDRQVHSIHCSFIPGITEADSSGTSGCHTTLMSPYSSVFRSSLWGGLPMSLMGMSVFAFLVYRGLDLWLRGRERDRAATLYLMLATIVPVLTSAVMGWLSFSKLDAACKMCIGIYISSLGSLIGALGVWRSAHQPSDEIDDEEEGSVDPLSFVKVFGQGVVFVAVPSLLYFAAVPDFSPYIGKCGTLPHPEDTNGVMVPLDRNPNGVPTIEVFDPLCPACRGFEERLETSDLHDRLQRKAVMFPLDNSCNWMVGVALHPGACTVSEAVLCAGDRANSVIDWAFANQEAIRTAAAANPKAAEQMVNTAFPDLAACVGKPQVKQKLNKSLRWAVANQLQVLTPQVFIDGVRMCDEDTDLGMERTLTTMLELRAAGKLVAAPAGGQP
jgi:uncharacterized membrane protein/protein-disulfide isomerase